MRRIIIKSAFLLTVLASQARAHFIWVDLRRPAQGESQARLYFGENPEPGSAHLIGKVAQAKTWLRTADRDTELKLAPVAEGDTALLAAACATPAAASLETICDYGVYERGPVGVLLQYYAKHLAGDWARHGDKLSRAGRLKLDVVPRLVANGLELQVLYDNKPAASAEVVITEPGGEQHELKTGTDGQSGLPKLHEGRFSIRVAHIEPDRAGTRDGKKYNQVWHYCTLTFDAKSIAQVAASEASALDLLTWARAGRALWTDFPGFSAELKVNAAGEQVAARATIDANGTVELDMPKSKLSDWVEEQLNSLVQHRMPDGEVTQGDVTYADNDTTHPLGRKIDLGDPSLQSAYRIKDDVILEVNRSMGPLRFTISVMEIVRNSEHKYLPKSFTMNFFDAKSGELKTSLGYLNEWQRVGRFDLPKTIVETSARQGGASTRQITFENCRLLESR